MSKYVLLCVKKDTAEMVRVHCVKHYKDQHPEFKKMQITDDKIIYELAKWFL